MLSIDEVMINLKELSQTSKYRILTEYVNTMGVDLYIRTSNDSLDSFRLTVSNYKRLDLRKDNDFDISYATNFISDVFTLRISGGYYKVRFDSNLYKMKIRKYSYEENAMGSQKGYIESTFPLEDEGDVFNLSVLSDCPYIPYINEIVKICRDMSIEAIKQYNDHFMREHV